jgi:2-polyprenyl-3-methyl-5-hydroxy-6-metoxy-1,4-benzoquinol methylase
MTVAGETTCAGPRLRSGRNLEVRARQSLGASSDAIHRMVARAIDRHHIRGSRVFDVGCGHGSLRAVLQHRFTEYRGLDAVLYSGFPSETEFTLVDLDRESWPVGSSSGDLVVAVETIEHLENPWAFVRTLAALAVPGGWVIVTTPNQLSVLSLMTLIVKRRFSAFQDAHYPAHRTALLEIDLRRIAEASGLEVIEVGYTLRGRLPLTGWHYPVAAARRWPVSLSDNLMIVARKPRA